MSSSRLADLLQAYESHVSAPWQRGLAGPQRLLFALYDKTVERRLRAQVDEFQLATQRAGHGWLFIDVTDEFPAWMSELRYRDSYFEEPELLEGYASGEITAFVRHLVEKLKTRVADAGEDTVVALLGVGALFGVARVSNIVNALAPSVPGRLLVFFPGEYDKRNNTYRLLDARDGWNYLAVPIQG